MLSRNKVYKEKISGKKFEVHNLNQLPFYCHVKGNLRWVKRSGQKKCHIFFFFLVFTQKRSSQFHSFFFLFFSDLLILCLAIYFCSRAVLDRFCRPCNTKEMHLIRHIRHSSKPTYEYFWKTCVICSQLHPPSRIALREGKGVLIPPPSHYLPLLGWEPDTEDAFFG